MLVSTAVRYAKGVIISLSAAKESIVAALAATSGSTIISSSQKSCKREAILQALCPSPP